MKRFVSRTWKARCVGDLVDMLDQPQPTISRHLNHLKKLGVLSCVRDGTWMWYEVADDLPDWCQDILDITYEQITPRGTSRDVSDLA